MRKYLYWCNECLWEERMDEHKYDFCPLCGHINISRRTAALYIQKEDDGK